MHIYPPETRIASRYEVASRPLLGGMGVVYLCYDHEAQRPVALKTFKPQYLPDRDARDRFLREGTTWVNLGRHPHVVHAYEVERLGDGREVFLVLEQIAKESGRPFTTSLQGAGIRHDSPVRPVCTLWPTTPNPHWSGAR